MAPAIAPADKLTHSVNIRVTEREHKAIHEVAYKHRTSASDVLRNLWQLYQQQEVAAKVAARKGPRNG